MITITFAWHAASPRPGRAPTIYEVLRDKLGREPTDVELCADVERILWESVAERAARGEAS